MENLHIVWLVSPFVSGAVNQPGDIQDERPTEHCSNEPCICECFTPEVHRNNCWKQKACDRHQIEVVSGEMKGNKYEKKSR